jgi:hypothetical protein
MADLWYYTCEGKQMEPVTGAELRQLAASGLLKPTDMVWTDGMDKWVRASSTRDLFSPEGRISTPQSLAEPRPEAPADRGDPREGRPRDDRSREDRPRRARRDSYRDDDDDDDRPRRRRRAASPPGMSTGLKVGLILGGSILGLILIVVVIVAVVKANQRQREAVAQMQNQFQNPPVVINPPVFPPMKDAPQFPVVGNHAPVFKGPYNVGPAGLTFNEQLTFADPRDVVMNQPCKVFTVNMVAGKTYTIRHNDVNKKINRNNIFQFDPYLRLEDSNFRQLAADDDSGGNLNALLIYRPAQTGLYRVIATTLRGTGSFTLQITVN